ncbi:MAG: tetratricopeptide repeat protein [Candidatus Melainabacteria bacterium]|jgi:tetratricopeptide (TPR) repeat protein|nr:tetratricopeptide repeat protein [Candidatus Melainabacteria bacterium]
MAFSQKQLDGLLYMAGRAFDNADYLAAQRHYEDALDMMERNGLSETEQALACFKNLAAIYYSDGKLDKAITAYSRLVVTSEKLLGEGNRDVIANMFILAKVCDGAGATEDAANIYSRVLRLAEQNLPKGDILIKHIREAAAIRSAPQKEFKQKVTALELPKPAFKETMETLVGGGEPGGRKHLLKKNQVILSTLGSLLVAVIAAGWFMWMTAGTTFQAPTAPGIMTEAFKVEGQAFRTADGKVNLTIGEHNTGSLKTPLETLQFKYKTIDFSLEGMQTLVLGAFARKEFWLEQTPSGLAGPNGFLVHTEEAPEVKTVEQMRALGAHLEEFYAKNGTFPPRLEKWTGDPAVKLVNSITKQDMIPTYQLMSKYQIVYPGVSNVEDFPKNLALGEQWNNAPEAGPGGINTFAIVTDKKVDEEFFRVSHVFMQGFDRKGKVIQSSIPNVYYFYCAMPANHMEGGDGAGDAYFKSLAATFNGANIFVVKEGAALFGLIPLKFTMPIIFGCLTGTSLLLWAFVDAAKRLENRKMLPTLLEVMTFIFALIWVVWYVNRVIP